MQAILVVDSDRDMCTVLLRFLTKKNYQVTVVHNGKEALHCIHSTDFDLIICDYKLPDLPGIEVLKKIKELNSTLPIIVINSYADVNSAIESFRCGANDYIVKPLFPDEFLLKVQETIAQSHTRLNKHPVPDGLTPKAFSLSANRISSTPFIIGKSPQSQEVQSNIELIAPFNISVIINGETGTGKEYVALSIHKFSKRAAFPFVAIDCGALHGELASSELFGHIKGAFTGATTDKKGSFELANGGTIFLDEIGNLSYENQIKLLRVIQERKIKRVGATKDISIDVRIIVATHENLALAVKEGKLREDLYHRLNEFKIQLAPLRERHDDLLFFTQYFLHQANLTLGKKIVGFSDTTLEIFNHYKWLGNLRELNNVIRQAALLCKGDIIQPDNLPGELLHNEELEVKMSNNESETMGSLKSMAWIAEKQAINNALRKVNFNKSRASQLLSIDRKTLYNKLKLYNIV
jgi:two-component system response regulator HydG